MNGRGYTLYQTKVKAYCTGLKTALKSILAGIGMPKFTRQAKNSPFRANETGFATGKTGGAFRDRKNRISNTDDRGRITRRRRADYTTTEGGLHDDRGLITRRRRADYTTTKNRVFSRMTDGVLVLFLAERLNKIEVD